MFYFWLDYYDTSIVGQMVKDYFLAMVAAGEKASVRFLPLTLQGIHADDTPRHYIPIVRRFGSGGQRELEGVLYAGALADVLGKPPEPLASVLVAPDQELTREEVEALARYKRVIVPSSRGAAWLRSQGLERVAVVPAPLDVVLWSDVPAQRPPSPFVFYAVGSWGAPDHVGQVVQAYLESFARDPRVLLHVVCPDSSLCTADDLQRLMPGCLPAELPFVSIDPQGSGALWKERRDWAGMHRSCHCYVSASEHPIMDPWALGAAAAGNLLVGAEALLAALEGEPPAQAVIPARPDLGEAMKRALSMAGARGKIGQGRQLATVGLRLAGVLREP